jgi:hypothetical protein
LYPSKEKGMNGREEKERKNFPLLLIFFLKVKEERKGKTFLFNFHFELFREMQEGGGNT